MASRFETIASIAATTMCLTGAVPRVAAGQVSERLIADAPACSTCRIAVVNYTTIADTLLIDGPIDMARDSRGRFYTVLSRYGLVAVFDERGKFLRVIGRTGEGPGEYRGLRAVAIGLGDTLFLFDSRTRRMTVLSPQYAVVRTAPVPVSVDGATVLNARRLVLNADVNDTARVGFPLHSIDALGNFLGSFGAAIRSRRPQDPYYLKRRISPATNGGVWQLHFSYENKFSHWSEDGALLEAFARRPAWFQPYTTILNPTPTVESSPLNVGIVQDKSGLLWIATRVADTKQKDNLVALKGPIERGIVPYVPTELSKGFDTMVEVIDPGRGVVVARQRFDGLAVSLLPGPLAVFANEDKNGFVQLQVQALSLQR